MPPQSIILGVRFAQPQPPKTLFNKSARSSGFKSTSNAIAELIDNPFDANATKVKVIFVEMLDENGRSSVQEIIVADDGEGMSKEILQDCLTFGGTANDDHDKIVANKKLGKFAFGLPNSSLSQSPHTDVYSWQKSGRPCHTSLDLIKALEENSIDVPAPMEVSLPADFAKLNAVVNKKQGTIIHWKECDRLSHKRADTLIRHAEELLGRVFRYLIRDGKQIIFEAYQRNRRRDGFTSLIASRRAVINDPLFLTEECVIAKDVYRQSTDHSNEKVRKHTEQFAIDETKCRPTNKRLDEHCFEYSFNWHGKKYRFEFVTSVAHKDIQKPGVREGGNTPVGRAYGRKEELGSICFIRSGREISSGRYGIYKATDARHRWWTIEVRFLPDSDDLLGVANNKQDIAFKYTTRDQQDEEYNEYEAGLLEARTELWICLSKHLTDIQKEALKAVKNDEKQFKLETATDPQSDPIPGQTQGTTSATITTDGQRESKLLC